MRPAYEFEKELSDWEKELAAITVERLTLCCPTSLAKIPHTEKRSYPCIMPRMLFAQFDGKRNLLEAIWRTSCSTNDKYSPDKCRATVEYLKYLEKYGYKGAFAQYLVVLASHPEGLTSAQLCEQSDRDKAAVSRVTKAPSNTSPASSIRSQACSRHRSASSSGSCRCCFLRCRASSGGSAAKGESRCRSAACKILIKQINPFCGLA